MWFRNGPSVTQWCPVLWDTGIPNNQPYPSKSPIWFIAAYNMCNYVYIYIHTHMYCIYIIYIHVYVHVYNPRIWDDVYHDPPFMVGLWDGDGIWFTT